MSRSNFNDRQKNNMTSDPATVGSQEQDERVFTEVEMIEKVNVERAKKLLKIPDKEFKSFLWEDGTENGEKEMDRETYLFLLKSFLKTVVKDAGRVKQNYKFSKHMKDRGRVYVERNFGVQKMKKKLRGYLVGEYYEDYDMVNAHPTILLWMVKKYFPDYSFPRLKEYIKNRNMILDKYDIEKEKILISLNSNRKVMSDVKFLKELDKEFKLAQKLFYDELPEELSDFEKYKKKKKENCKGSFLNCLMTIWENRILCEAMSIVSEEFWGTPCFDGMLMEKGLNILGDLNEATHKYGIVWKIKEHDTYIEDNIDDLEYEELVSMDYADVKERFEKEYCMIENPFLFAREMGNEIVLYNKTDFMGVTNIWSYEKVIKDKIVEKRFVKDWLDDKNLRRYERIDWYPGTLDDENVLNTFNGFKYNLLDGTYDQESVDLFTGHVNHLMNGDKVCYDYLIKYLAHMIQKPHELPEAIIVMKGIQGTGKDTLLEVMGDIIGREFCYLAEDGVRDILGSFNGSLEKKIIVRINELEGKDGFMYKENIKGLSTSNELVINHKGLKKYSQKNFTRLFIFSNNLNPLEVSHDDRRLVVFRPQKKVSRDKVAKLKNLKKDGLWSIWKFLNEVDLKDYDPRERPITHDYQEMRENSIHPVYRFVKKIFIDGSDYEKLKKNKDGAYVVPNYTFKEDLDEFIEDEGITGFKTSFKILKGLLNSVNVQTKLVKISGKPTQCYLFKIDNFIDRILDICQEEDIEEI